MNIISKEKVEELLKSGKYEVRECDIEYAYEEDMGISAVIADSYIEEKHSVLILVKSRK